MAPQKYFYKLSELKKSLAPGIDWAVINGTHMTVVYYEMKAGAPMPINAHKHPHYQFTLPVEGMIEQTVGNETRVVSPGQLVYIAPNVVHKGRLVGHDCKMFDIFTPQRHDHYQNYIMGKPALPGGADVQDEETPKLELPSFINLEELSIQLTEGCSLAPFDVPAMTAAFLQVGVDPEEDRHHHIYEQINIYLAGEMLMTVDNCRQVVGPGWVVVIPPDVPHDGVMLKPALQVNFSSPARGPGYADFLRKTFAKK